MATVEKCYVTITLITIIVFINNKYLCMIVSCLSEIIRIAYVLNTWWVTLVAEDGFAMKTSGKHISLSAPFANGDPVKWFRRFKICCRANDWDAKIKAKKLPTYQGGGLHSAKF